MSRDGYLPPGVEHADIDRHFGGGEGPDCRECDARMHVVNSYTFVCRNRDCEQEGEEIDAEAFEPDPDAEG